MNWPKLPNRKPFLDKGYTSVQMREYAEKCVKQAIATEDSSETQEPVECKPDRSGKYLTIVYRDVDIGDEVLALTRHEKSCAMSWSNALWDVAYLKSITHPPQRSEDAKQPKAEQEPKREWVGLTDDEIMDMYNEPRSDAEMITFGREVEAKLKEKNT